ncbi:MAG: LysM peptidoglycan-binding domain-containing protein [Sporocytophaga sp.]|uniref:LysM peptidoglycan-binding domain-containing protein n=1 Tax=Sporocytophaga sp. TaxID=2231183 RepID=UPI001B284DB1|nr:LysM peptidoglycan-binding domain-containing protein [Sporocytophaga sp.]MBO9699466.1 LysM peptidoglycan-binding domain-containing protein [Sporocytophaga sp.]
MTKRFFQVCLLFLLGNTPVFSSPLDSLGVVKIDDKLHVKYLVSPGETIYGISTKYGVSVNDLMEINPQLENGLKVGQIINIPYNPEIVQQIRKSEDAIVHKVAAGETLFGISKKYNIPMNDLLKWNGMELKAGQEIVVGYKSQQNASSTIAHNATPKSEPVKQSITTEQPKTTPTVNTTNAQSAKPAPAAETKEPVKQIAVAEKTTPAEKSAKPQPMAASTNEQSNNAATAWPTSAPEQYRYDPEMKQILVIPFDPYLYFSDADDEIAAKSNMPRTKVRQVFRRRLNALLDKPGYEMIYLVGGKAKDSIGDLNKIYSSVSYAYQESVTTVNVQQQEVKEAKAKSTKNWIEKQKEKLIPQNEKKYDVPEDYGSYFGVKIKNPQDFFDYFNSKYSVDYYVFINQFEVKTDYEHCLDRAALNFERSFTTHFSIYDSEGKQVAGNKFKTHYNSNSNYVYQIVADNCPKIAERILSELPAPDQK